MAMRSSTVSHQRPWYQDRRCDHGKKIALRPLGAGRFFITQENWLFLGGFGRIHGGVDGGLAGGELGVLLLEAFDAAGGINELLLAGVEGVADAADFDFDVLGGRAGFKGVAAGAANLRKVVSGMDFLLHGV